MHAHTLVASEFIQMHWHTHTRIEEGDSETMERR